jgi:hypothetical protein
MGTGGGKLEQIRGRLRAVLTFRYGVLGYVVDPKPAK